jgi:hypothetical protein
MLRSRNPPFLCLRFLSTFSPPPLVYSRTERLHAGVPTMALAHRDSEARDSSKT